MAQAGEDLKRGERLIYLLVVVAVQAILLGLLLPPSLPMWLGHLLTRREITGGDIFLLALLVAFIGSTVFTVAWWAWSVMREVRAWNRGRGKPGAPADRPRV
jgi:hypothetical protein